VAHWAGSSRCSADARSLRAAGRKEPQEPIVTINDVKQETSILRDAALLLWVQCFYHEIPASYARPSALYTRDRCKERTLPGRKDEHHCPFSWQGLTTRGSRLLDSCNHSMSSSVLLITNAISRSFLSCAPELFVRFVRAHRPGLPCCFEPETNMLDPHMAPASPRHRPCSSSPSAFRS
jgi:hypothetical protein